MGKKIDDRVWVVPFTHIYLTRGFDVLNDKAPKRHGCLRMGYWCWQNAWEHPKDIITYFKRKFRSINQTKEEVGK